MKILILILAALPWAAVSSQAPPVESTTSTFGTISPSAFGIQADCGPPFVQWANGPKSCNCGSLEVTESKCHTEEVKIDVGGEFIGVSTGRSDTQCATITIPAGICVWVSYKSRCFYKKNFWTQRCNLVCANDGLAYNDGPVGAGDCSN
ncbi:MAG: hypothetical protein O3A50_02235 [Planctomycetota bacterium]|nr:hypothetical protein [Planctomycetota bacterium]